MSRELFLALACGGQRADQRGRPMMAMAADGE